MLVPAPLAACEFLGSLMEPAGAGRGGGRRGAWHEWFSLAVINCNNL